jgi:hypothetical protein
MGIDMNEARKRAISLGKKYEGGYPKLVPMGLGLIAWADSKEDEESKRKFAFRSSLAIIVVMFASLCSLPAFIIGRNLGWW